MEVPLLTSVLHRENVDTERVSFSLSEVTSDSFLSLLPHGLSFFWSSLLAPVGPRVLPVSPLPWFWTLSTTLATAEAAFLRELRPGVRLDLSRKILCLF